MAAAAAPADDPEEAKKAEQFYNRYVRGDGKKDEEDLIDSLFKPVGKGPEDHYYNATAKNAVQQADLLFLPKDNGFRYALVAYDLSTRELDAEPVKTKNADEVLKAFRAIYARGRLAPPKRLEVDAGTEFQGPVAAYFKQQGTFIRPGRPGRHSQQGGVENINRILGRAISMRQAAEELHTGKPSRQWVDDLPGFVKAMNEQLERKPPKPLPADEMPVTGPKLYEVGQRVRVRLDRPFSVDGDGKKLPGELRAGDPKWEKQVRTIEHVRLIPGAIVRYIVSGIPMTTFTYNELQEVKTEPEAAPPAKLVVRKPPADTPAEELADAAPPAPKGAAAKKKERLDLERQGLYVPYRIRGEEGSGKNLRYLIQWTGYPHKKDYTWEPAAMLKTKDGFPKLLERWQAERANDDDDDD